VDIRKATWALAAVLALGVPASALAQVASYRIKPGDLLHISVWLEEDLDRKVLVRPDGGITFPLAGDLEAAGKTVRELNAEVSKKVQAYVKEAIVTVALEENRGNTVYVVGEVKEPGAFVMNPTLTVLQALALAGGMTPYASQGDILVLRKDGDRQRPIPFNYKDIKKGANLEQNITLESGDVVLVP
jgi:polysaccharide export outer membrane protein